MLTRGWHRKKPTQERGSTDGGLKIFVEEKSVLWDPHRVECVLYRMCPL